MQGPCPVAGLRMLCLGAAGEPLERSAGLLYAFMINFVRITHVTSLLHLLWAGAATLCDLAA